jgi:general stress protein 26
MSYRRPGAFLAIPLCACMLAAGGELLARQGPPAAPSREHLLAVARRVMEKSRFAALVTVDPTGRPQARTMDPLSPDADLVVRMATNPRSRKVEEIEKNPRVALYYFDPQTSAYVALNGLARLVSDPQQKKRWWKTEWAEFYPDREGSYLLIEVRPERLEVVSVADGIDTDPTTWAPAAVEFPAPR